ncbi:PREDICTED: LIM and SH3 domain protein 1-like [Amphimedon queenslandica]|uniref:LIM and SH3 domain protein 1 n=1 Tax=Amphimedon queenslandica TaxID=400682 RepID=A0A1X7V9I8_AMPQE|nr:PREDICTED: LIM and SH3 domain protein 1-like [Amphimedon queenslandica]|eukprot:XP_003385285.1 PREDICTED: LIM and SH3 domain protein 1-like [Amphimedon queenslandica]
MNPPCARCKKTVYPVEKFNCLDKVWHKACFTCEVCNLKLTMKTYKGYNKLPYCNTHYPTTKFTQVADTPENKRLANQTKQQSDLVYRKDREEALKHFTQASDSVATRQAQQAGKLASNIGYQSAPHEVEGHRPPPQSYNPPQPSYNPPQPSYNPPPPQSYQPPAPQPSYQPPPPQPSYNPPPPAPAPSGPRWTAVYDYAAADDDEVSFQEGDHIIDAEVIDDGWMEGTVERTGQRGMLPSNYVEKV